ncbi:hypothetical protein EYF80_048588 [Liparis tanakae]|uniref:Uncharacterized protein n=1 Tax=Liparis tanakae TaxID=230148 RepID=A0A4Z2FKH3_9TELE|nr:hypothetical protein EYF80_048588 [Liparis tanakae]
MDGCCDGKLFLSLEDTRNIEEAFREWEFIPANGEMFTPAHGEMFTPANGEMFTPAQVEMFTPAHGEMFTPV